MQYIPIENEKGHTNNFLFHYRNIMEFCFVEFTQITRAFPFMNKGLGRLQEARITSNFTIYSLAGCAFIAKCQTRRLVLYSRPKTQDLPMKKRSQFRDNTNTDFSYHNMSFFYVLQIPVIQFFTCQKEHFGYPQFYSS